MTESSEGLVARPVNALLPGRIGMLVRIPAKPGARTAVLDILNRYIDAIAVDEPGTEMFLVCLDPDDEDLVWLHEWFRDSDAQVAHQQSSAFHRMMEEMPPLLAGPPGIVRIDPLRLHLAGNVVDESM